MPWMVLRYQAKRHESVDDALKTLATSTHLFQCVLELVNKAGKTSGRMIWMFSPIKVTIYGLFQ